MRVEALGRNAGTGNGALFNRFLVVAAEHEAVDIDAGNMYLVRIEFTNLNDLFDLGHRDAARFGAGNVEVVGRLVHHQVACFVGFPGLDDRQVGLNALFQNIGETIEILGLFPFA